MVIPQLKGWQKGILAIGGAALISTLGAAYHHGEVKDWETLIPALKHSSFEGFMAALLATGTWLGVQSPFSQTAQNDKAITREVVAAGVAPGKEATAMVEQIQKAATVATVEQIRAEGVPVPTPNDALPLDTLGD